MTCRIQDYFTHLHVNSIKTVKEKSNKYSTIEISMKSCTALTIYLFCSSDRDGSPYSNTFKVGLQMSDTVVNNSRLMFAYELVPEAYRQKFRNCRKGSDQTHVEFARTKKAII